MITSPFLSFFATHFSQYSSENSLNYSTHSQLNFFEILDIFILYNDRKGVLSSQNLNNIHIHYLK